MTLLQQYLRSGNSLASLTEKYGILVKPDSEHPNLILFKYNQIESPMGERIVQECRGIILDSEDNWRIVSRAFDKFFNHHEGHAAEIDWGNFYVQEKLDGSLMTLYFYKGKWRVASSGNPSAQGEIYTQNTEGEQREKIRFADYFWNAFNDNGLKLPDEKFAGDYCFIFELTGPLNRVVVVHEKTSVTLLSARNLVTQQEILAHDVNELFQLNWPVVQYHSYSSLKELLLSFEGKSPLSHEGCVVLSKILNEHGSFPRQKCKMPSYVAIHHARDGFSEKTCLEVIRNGEISEVVALFPEFKSISDRVQSRYDKLIEYVECEYEKYKNVGLEGDKKIAQKEFAMALKNNNVKCSDAMFCLRSGKATSVKQFYKDYNLDKLMEILEKI